MMPGHWADFCRLEIKKKKKQTPILRKTDKWKNHFSSMCLGYMQKYIEKRKTAFL
jgi:hypothetical protein